MKTPIHDLLEHIQQVRAPNDQAEAQEKLALDQVRLHALHVLLECIQTQQIQIDQHVKLERILLQEVEAVQVVILDT